MVHPARPLIYSAVGYLAIGVASAVFSNPVESRGLQALMRLGALGLGALVFVCHIRYEILRLANAPRTTAIRAAGGVALGTFGLAAYAVLYNVLVRSRSIGSVSLVLVVWPAVTGGLGFLGATALARVIAWWASRRRARKERSV